MRSPVPHLLLVLAAAAGLLQAAEPRVKGTHIMLSAPKGFVAADRFPGFMAKDSGASVMITEIPGPYAEVAKGVNPEGLKKQGMTLLSKQDAAFGAHQGVLIHAAQEAEGVAYLKWMAVFGSAEATYLVTATFPKDKAPELSDLLKQNLLSARVSTAQIDPMEALHFRVTPSGGMKIAKAMGNALMMSKGGVFPAKSSEIPILVVAPSIGKGIPVPERKVFAEGRLLKVATLRDIAIRKTESIQVAGMEGYESDATAVDQGSGVKMLAYQVILCDDEGYYLMQGLAPERERETVLVEFKQIARSFTKGEDTGKPAAP